MDIVTQKEKPASQTAKEPACRLRQPVSDDTTLQHEDMLSNGINGRTDILTVKQHITVL
jgi:hypothetical protein